jgi:predicted ester cyclase
LQAPQGVLAPTGKKVRVRMAAVFEFEPGGTGIVCERVYFDSATILRQLTN